MKKLIVVLSLLIAGCLVVGCKTNVEPEPENPKTEVTKKDTETKWNVTKEKLILDFYTMDNEKYTVEGYKFKVVTYPENVDIEEGALIAYHANWQNTFGDYSYGPEAEAVIFDEDVESEIEKILNSGSGYEIKTIENDKYVFLDGNEEKWCSKGVQEAKDSKQGPKEATSWDDVTISSVSKLATVSSINCPEAFKKKYEAHWPTPEKARNIKILWKDAEKNYHAVVGESESEIRNRLNTEKPSFEPVKTYISKYGWTQNCFFEDGEEGEYCIVLN